MDLKRRVSLYKITESLQNSFLEQGLNIPKNVIRNSINLELIKELNDFVDKYNMDGLQLLKEVRDINKRLKLISFIIEKPIYKGGLEENDLSKETTEFLGRTDKIKEQLKNLKFIKT